MSNKLRPSASEGRSLERFEEQEGAWVERVTEKERHRREHLALVALDEKQIHKRKP